MMIACCRVSTHLQLILLFITLQPPRFSFFFFNDTATTEIYTLSLHDALPIYVGPVTIFDCQRSTDTPACSAVISFAARSRDRKSTRLNSSHDQISYAVFCLKKKKRQTTN